MLKHIGIYLSLIIGLISCNIKEDMSNCPGTILLDYTSYPKEILDEIDPNEQVSVYIFDTKGDCCKIYRYTYGELEDINFEFKVPIQYNGLNAVVWHGNDCNCYSCDEMVKGKSYKDFMLQLNYDIATASFSRVPSSLWAAPLEPIDYCAAITRHRIHMTRVHTRINVNLRQKQVDGSIKELNMDDYLTTIFAKNDIYRTDYTISRQSQELQFNNAEELEQNTYLDWAHVGTLRITPEMDCTMQIAPVDDLDNPITIAGSTNLDLVKYMLERKGEDSRAKELSDQRFLDLNKVWNIDLLIDTGKVAVSLTINGWTIWFDNIDL